MDLSNLEVGMEIKNYKELCTLLGEKVKSGNSKKYQMIDFERFFTYKKEGYKFIITDILSEVQEKTKKSSNNTLPFIDDMELLLLDLLLKKGEESTILSTSKLMLELCMINPNYHKYFTDRDNLSQLLDMDIGFIIDFYDTTNSTFKSAINTVTKRLESKKLIIHESVMMVQFIDTNIEVTPTGYAKATDILEFDDDAKEFISKNIKPKQIYRPATNEEREHILKVERRVLEDNYNSDNIQQVFKNGQIHNYYKDVSNILYKELNIKKAYKANRYTYNINELQKQKIKLLDEYELKEYKNKINLNVMLRIDDGSNKRYEKAMSKLLEFDEYHHSKPFRADIDYVDNINTISNSLIDINNVDSLSVKPEDNDILDHIQ